MIGDNKYNEDPVYYCEHCLSLHIIEEPEGICYCKKCGSTQINTASLNEYDALHLNKFGTKLFNK